MCGNVLQSIGVQHVLFLQFQCPCHSEVRSASESSVKTMILTNDVILKGFALKNLLLRHVA